MSEEIKNLIEDLGRQHREFVQANDARLKAVESKGHADPLIEAKLDKLNAAMDESRKRLDAIDVAFKRAAKDGAENKDGNAEHKAAFLKFMRKGERALHADEFKALSTSTDPDGGYLVRPEVSAEIVRNITETSPMRALASVQNISAHALEVPRVTNDAASGGWVGESETRSESAAPKVGVITITAFEVYAEPRATQTLLDDAGVNVEAWLADEVAAAFAYAEATAFISGNGVKKPRGILSYAAGTGDGQVEQVVSGNANLLTADGLIDLQTALKEPYQRNATWLMTRATVGAIRKFKDTTNQYLWQPGLAVGVADNLLGRPIALAADMPTVAANNLAVAYGDFRMAYKIVDRIGMRVIRDEVTSKPFVKFYTTKRVGGEVVRHEAVKLQKVSA